MASINNKSVMNTARQVAPSAVVQPNTYPKTSHNVRNHHGAQSYLTSPLEQLRRTVLSCMLWENTAYESGQSIASRISSLVPKCDPADVAHLAKEARTLMKLRHVPLLLCVEMLKHPEHKKWVRKTVGAVIERPDELGQVLALYWKDHLTPSRQSVPNEPSVKYVSQRKSKLNLPLQLRRGIEDAFKKFDSYQISKYQMKDSPITMKDVLRIVHPKTNDEKLKKTYEAVTDGTASVPDTWETRLVEAGKEYSKSDYVGRESEREQLIRDAKKNIFVDLIDRNKLGAMALLRNIRGMSEAGVSIDKISSAISKMNTERVLPYRFITAARHAPAPLHPALSDAMLKSLSEIENLPGHTIILIDISGSMSSGMSKKSELNRIDGAAGLAIMVKEICDSSDIFLFDDNTYQIVGRSVNLLNGGRSYYGSNVNISPYQRTSDTVRGFELANLITSSVRGGTNIRQAIDYLNQNVQYDRLIVFTDEQSSTTAPDPKSLGYIVNVATNENGIGYGKYVHINGFSESIIAYIAEYEKYLTELAESQ